MKIIDFTNSAASAEEAVHELPHGPALFVNWIPQIDKEIYVLNSKKIPIFFFFSFFFFFF